MLLNSKNDLKKGFASDFKMFFLCAPNVSSGGLEILFFMIEVLMKLLKNVRVVSLYTHFIGLYFLKKSKKGITGGGLKIFCETLHQRAA